MGCVWNARDEEFSNSASDFSEDTRNRRQARRRLNDFVDVFDPRLDTKEDGDASLATLSPNADDRGNGRLGNPNGLPASDKPGTIRTNSLDRLVDTFLEAKSKLTRGEFSVLEIGIVGLGSLRLEAYFIRINKASLTIHGRVLFGGATLVKRYGQGFRLKFYDPVEGLPVFLYVPSEAMAAYRYRKYLAHIIDQADSVRYLNVFALGQLSHMPGHGSINVVISDLRHLSIVLGPPKPFKLSGEASPSASNNSATK